MHQHRKTPLRAPIVAAFVTLFVAFLFGGVTRADEASLQSSSITTEAQSTGAATTVADTGNETQSSSGVATAATTDNGPASCTPQDISPGEISTTLRTLDGSEEFTAYEAVEFSVLLDLEQGHCGGDSATITVPSELGADGGFTPIPMTTPEGVTIGHATYSADHTVVITLTSEVEVPGRKDFHASSWWRVHMSSALVPGETRDLIWNIDGVIRRTVISVGTCNGCSHPGVRPSKWGSVDGSQQKVTIVLPTAHHDGQEFVVTDTLISSGQSFNCDRLLTGRIGVYSEAGPWGQPKYVRFMEPDVVSCANDKAVLNVKLDRGEKARFQLNIDVSATDPGPWTDSVNITSQDKSWEVSTKVTRKESGGNAGFDTTPTPAPTPAPTPSATPAPSPTPSATPTPTPTPSATPEPSPTPAPRQFKLPVTGAAENVATSAIALAALGGVVLWVRRRQTACSED